MDGGVEEERGPAWLDRWVQAPIGETINCRVGVGVNGAYKGGRGTANSDRLDW